MKRGEMNVQTGEYREIDLTPEEEAGILARAAAHANHPDTIRAVADAAATEVVKADATINYLRTHTPAECYTKVQNDVTDLASAKAMMGRFAMALCVLTRKM